MHSSCVRGCSRGRGTPSPHRGPLSILDVPFISQSEALCGGAAAAMVLRFWGERGLDAESFAHLVDRSAGGIRTTRLVDDLRQRGWNATGCRGREDLIDAELARGRPVLTLIEDRPGTFHYVVIVAATPQAIVFHDPARAPVSCDGTRAVSHADGRRPIDGWPSSCPAEPSRSSEPPPLVTEAADGASCAQPHDDRHSARPGRGVGGRRAESDCGVVVRRDQHAFESSPDCVCCNGGGPK